MKLKSKKYKMLLFMGFLLVFSGFIGDYSFKNINPIKISLRMSKTNWSIPADIISTESAGESLWPAIKVDDSGNLNVVWQDLTDYSGAGTDYDIFYKFKNATNDIWTISEVISTESSDESSRPAIDVDSTGNIHVAWQDLTNYNGSGIDYDIFYKFKNITTGAWSTTEVVSTESTDDCTELALAIDEDDNIHLAWKDWTNYGGSGVDTDIFYKYKNATTNIWTTTEVISTESTENSGFPTMAVDSVGNIHVAWCDWTNYSDSGVDLDIFYKFKNATTNLWTTTEVVSTESISTSAELAIALDSADNIHIVWRDHTDYDGAGTDRDIFYKAKNAITNTWTITEVVSTESTGHSWYPTIAADSVGNIHVAWDDDTNYYGSGTDLDIFYKFKNVTANTWTKTEVVSTESTMESNVAKIAVDDVGNIHVVWWDKTDYNGAGIDTDIFYKFKNIIKIPLTINSPDDDQGFADIAPTFNLTVVNYDSIWYSLDNGITNTTCGTSGQINSALWNDLTDGTYTLRFYANSSSGLISTATISIYKDTEVPIISIIDPSINDVFEFTPAFEISITESNLDTIWYTLDEGENNFTASGLTGIINQEHWESLPNGYITLRFYANDTLGHLNFDEVIIVKDTPTRSPGIPGYDLFLLLGIISLAAVIIIEFKFYKKIK